MQTRFGCPPRPIEHRAADGWCDSGTLVIDGHLFQINSFQNSPQIHLQNMGNKNSKPKVTENAAVVSAQGNTRALFGQLNHETISRLGVPSSTISAPKPKPREENAAVVARSGASRPTPRASHNAAETSFGATSSQQNYQLPESLTSTVLRPNVHEPMQSKHSSEARNDRVPDDLCDMAFSCEIMKDPVVAADGYTYNRKEIELWFAKHNVRTFRHSFVPPFFLSFFSKTSPKTSQALPHKMLIPNMDLRARVIAWRDAHGLPAPRIANPKDVDVPGPVSASNQGNKGRESVLRDGKEKTQQIKHDLAHFNAVFMPTIIFAFALVCLCDSKENSARLGYPFTLVLSAIMACDAHTLLCPSSCMFFECHLHSYKLSAVINLPRAIISHFF
jgi:hypothetical protein